jgi:mannosyltransferase
MKLINKKYSMIILFLIIIAGFSLRFYHLDQESLWFDEGFTVNSVSQESLPKVIEQANKFETKPPGFYLITHYWTKIFGLSEFSLRFVSLIFGTISVFLIYFLGKELFNRQVGILSSFLMSISLFDIIYSQEARVFALFSMATILSFFIFVKLIKRLPQISSKKNNFYLWLFIINALINSIHYFGWIIFCVQNIIFISLFKNRKRSLEKWFFYQFLIILAFVPFLVEFIKDFSWFHNLLTNVFLLRWGLPVFISKLGFLIFLIGPIIFILVTFLIVKKWKVVIQIYEQIKPAFWLIPIMGYYLISLFFVRDLYSPFFLTRYSLFILPFLFIFFAKVISDNSKWVKRSVILIIFLLSLFSLSIYYQETTKEQWGEVASFVKSEERVGETAFFDVGLSKVVFKYYYYDFDNIPLTLKKQSKASLALVELNENNENYLLGNPSQSFWLILSHNRNDFDHYSSLIAKDLYLDLEKEYKGIKVYHFSVMKG